MQRMAELYQAGKQIVVQRVLNERPDISPRQLEIEVARVMYRKDLQIQKILDRLERNE